MLVWYNIRGKGGYRTNILAACLIFRIHLSEKIENPILNKIMYKHFKN